VTAPAAAPVQPTTAAALRPSLPAGTWRLLRLAARRDRVLVPIWVGCLIATAVASITATTDLYSTVADRVAAAESINSTPAIVAIYGPISDVTSLGQVALFKMVLLGALFLAFLCALLIRRHTRVDEESGRAELVLSTVVATVAPLIAAVIEAVVVSFGTGLLTAAGLVAAGLDVAGSLAFGLSWAGIGLFATGVAAVAVQLSASARTAGGITAAVLAVAYVVRAVGDIGAGGWLTWLSPFGWATKVEAFDADRWWVLGLDLLLSAGLLLSAVVLRARRDLGSGLVPARPGPAAGRLGTFPGLVERLVRTGLVGWLGSLMLLGVVLGGIATNAGDMLTSDAAREMFERLGGQGAAEEMFLAAEFSILGAAVSAWAITIATRMTGEETSGRTEAVLATGVSRTTLFLSVVGAMLAGSLLLLAGVGLSAGISYGLGAHDVAAKVPELVGAALVQAPAAWVVAALALLCWAIAPRFGSGGWFVLAAFTILGQLGALIGLPDQVLQISPFAHAPKAPVESVDWGAQALLVAIALVITGGAWWRYRSRDIG
jgi:ABC-2 type transport system permease protein